MSDHIISDDGSIFYGDTPFPIELSEDEIAYAFCHEVELKAAILEVTVDYYLMEFV